MNLKSFRNKWMFHELVKDLGFVNWNESTKHIQGDTSIRFSGIQFNDILNFEGTHPFIKIEGCDLK